VTAVVEGASPKSGTGPVPETKCIVFRYIMWEKSIKFVSSNATHRFQNFIL